MFGLFDSLSLLDWILGSIGLLFVLVCTFVYSHWPSHCFKAQGIPGPKPRFILSDFAAMGTKTLWELDADYVKEYGKIVGICAVNRKYLLTSDVDMLKEVYVKDFDCFCDRPVLPNRGIMKNSVFDMNGEAWKEQRHQLSPYFTTGTLKMSVAAINRVLDNFICLLDEKCDKGEMIEFRNVSQLMTLDAICSTAYGVEVNSVKNPDMELLQKARELNNKFTTGNFLFMFSFIFPWFGKLLDLLNIESVDSTYFQKFTKQLIEQRKQSKKDEFHDFVSILLQDRKRTNEGLTDDEVIANAIIFLIAGYDTTATSLSFLLYNLAINPEWQEKVYQEIDENIDAKKLTYDDVQKLSCLDMCIEESLRLYPIGVRLERLCVKDTVVKGIPVKKNTIVAYPVWSMQRDPEIWEDPEKFNPERFTPENKKSRNPMYYSPFGVGPRHCIGMRLAQIEVKMAVVRIIQRYKLVKNSKTQVPLELSRTSLQLQAKDGIWLSLERRQ